MTRDGKLLVKSYSEVRTDVEQLMSDLRDCDLGAGDLVGVLGPNSYEWAVADLALLGLGCVSVAVPTEPSNRPVDIRGISERYQLSAVLVTGPLRVDGDLPPEAAVLGDGRSTLRKRIVADPPSLPEEVFTIAFSSGTAGTTKGLMVSQLGISNTIQQTGLAWEVTPDDDVLIAMPFSSLQQRVMLYVAIWFGFDATVVAPERMFQKLRDLAPTIILGPPSFFEIVETRLRAASAREALPRHLAAALHLVPGDASLRLRQRLGRRWTDIYGRRARLLLTGSAPVSPRLVALFHQLGRPLYEIYGCTEVGWVTSNLPGAYRIGTAGRPVKGVEVTIGSDDEILVDARCPQVLGYVFDGVETQDAVFRPDGTIATGDLGHLDGDGYLQLVGRKKNVIVTRSGVKINPEELEHDIEASCQVKKAVVVSNGHGSSLSCVVWLDEWQEAERVQAIETYISNANAKKDSAHKISNVVFRPDQELTPETGLLTRNLKVDRNAVMQKVFADGERVAQ
ncbi:MAG TPA: AMP-binding protein [Acidimicrobiales bacterium]|nr:AMP-binding protein [Acidimicrobiales bacterium]